MLLDHQTLDFSPSERRSECTATSRERNNRSLRYAPDLNCLSDNEESKRTCLFSMNSTGLTTAAV